LPLEKNSFLNLFQRFSPIRGERRDRDQEELIEELYRQIGQLKVELDWLKKNAETPLLRKREEVER